MLNYGRKYPFRPPNPTQQQEEQMEAKRDDNVEAIADIFVKRVDVNLLRQQRDEILRVMKMPDCDTPLLDGLVALLDAMLDTAEGYPC